MLDLMDYANSAHKVSIKLMEPATPALMTESITLHWKNVYAMRLITNSGIQIPVLSASILIIGIMEIWSVNNAQLSKFIILIKDNASTAQQ